MTKSELAALGCFFGSLAALIAVAQAGWLGG